jgi:hypothetical protein
MARYGSDKVMVGELYRKALIAPKLRQTHVTGRVFGSRAFQIRLPGDLFDVPRDGAMGLVWWLKSRTVTVLGPEHAGVASLLMIA